MEYHTRTRSVAVTQKGAGMLDDCTTIITITDEGGGEFLEIEQPRETGRITIGKNEWAYIREAIDKMFEQCEQ